MRNDGRAKEATVVLSTAVPNYTHAGTCIHMYMYIYTVGNMRIIQPVQHPTGFRRATVAVV